MPKKPMIYLKNGQIFVDDLVKKSGLTQWELALEAGLNGGYLSGVAQRNNITPPAFSFFCKVYDLNMNDYQAGGKGRCEKKAEHHFEETNRDYNTPSQNTLNSINSTLLEINRSLKSINDSLNRLKGYDANINENTYAVKQELAKLNKALNG